jgi:2-polyprenyl-6-methoxyphenol hydroxylase-like FAD-dependent oxidoreductase
MRTVPLNILIIGAGTGGLCLAQGLKRDDVAFDVFERDHSASEGLQGYRLSLNACGIQALEQCLPPPLFAQLERVSGKPSQGLTFMDEHLERLLGLDFTHSRPSIASRPRFARLSSGASHTHDGRVCCV